MPLPKKIHFIWAGGEDLLPEKNNDFEIYLWIDQETTSKEKLNEYYSRYGFNENPKIKLLDITEEDVVDEYSRYHINKLLPNYGASSDILR